MRIGIVSEYFRPWPGGISEHVYHEACELRRRGHQVAIITGSAGSSPDAFGVIRVGVGVRFESNGSQARVAVGPFVFRMRRLLRALQLDVLHLHAPFDPFLPAAALLASESANVGTFHVSAGDGPNRLARMATQTFSPLLALLAQRLHVRIGVSAEAIRAATQLFPGNYDVVPNGVDTERFHPACAPFGDTADGDLKILFVGRHDPRKGLALLLTAFGQIHERIGKTRLVIVSELDDAQRGDLLRLLPACARSAVTFAGFVDPAKLPQYYASCDIVCSPATGRESQGVVLLEAMAAARPVVAFDIAGYREVIRHQSNGWLVPRIDADALAESLIHLLQNGKLRSDLAAAGRSTALAYSWPSVVTRLEERFLAAREIAGTYQRKQNEYGSVGLNASEASERFERPFTRY